MYLYFAMVLHFHLAIFLGLPYPKKAGLSPPERPERLRSRKAVQQCPAGPLRKLLSEMLLKSEDQAKRKEKRKSWRVLGWLSITLSHE